MGKCKNTRKIPLKQKLIGDRNLTLQERLENSGLFPKGKMNIIQSPGEKMSEVLLDFADPLLNGNEDISELDRKIGFLLQLKQAAEAMWVRLTTVPLK